MSQIAVYFASLHRSPISDSLAPSQWNHPQLYSIFLATQSLACMHIIIIISEYSSWLSGNLSETCQNCHRMTNYRHKQKSGKRARSATDRVTVLGIRIMLNVERARHTAVDHTWKTVNGHLLHNKHSFF